MALRKVLASMYLQKVLVIIIMWHKSVLGRVDSKTRIHYLASSSFSRNFFLFNIRIELEACMYLCCEASLSKVTRPPRAGPEWLDLRAFLPGGGCASLTSGKSCDLGRGESVLLEGVGLETSLGVTGESSAFAGVSST